MNGREFLALAEELGQRRTEVSWRTAIGRAYYAAFHRARDFLASLGFVTRRSDQTHAGLYRRLSGSKYAPFVEIARGLMELRGLRNQANYDLEHPIKQSDVQKALDETRQIFDVLDAPRDKSVVNSVIETIREYERDVLREVTWRSPN